MSLQAAEQLGPYRIVAAIGAGGMGEVYRARDTRLERDVAIKILPERIAADGEALARFQREAKAVAALAHPNILAVYDVGTDRGITYLVMELLEGQTLRERIRRARPPWRKSVEQAIATRTDFDLVGRRMRLVEDETGALQRQTDFAYDRLSQLTTQTAKNKTSTGTPLADQLTTYRYDSLGRQTRIVYPDAPIAQHNDPSTCTDCVRETFDLAGWMTQRIDQRALTTTYTYDDRGLLLTRTTGTDRDTFGYDAVGRITLADRGTTINQDAVSHSAMGYTDLGDLDFETQAIAEGASRTVDYSYDQAGNRKQLTYPGGEMLAYTPTALNQVDTVNLNAAPFLNYEYLGRLLDKRRTTTTAPGGTTIYEYDVGYDSHRRVNSIANRFQHGGRSLQTLAAYGFSHDANGNPLTQTVADGLPAFVADDRDFTVDRLNRLTGTGYFETGQIESTTFDLVGNRESHTDRAGTVTTYGTVNAANEYSTIGGSPVTFDAAGNLIVDQNGRQYSYDELNRLKQVKSSTNVVLANYTYDALGRRITFNDPVAGVTTRYYYDGQSVIEERNAADTRVRYHVNGSQYIDERVATFTDASGAFAYYLGSNNFSITGTGNTDGSIIERLDYSSTGDFAGGGPGASAFYHDADDDLDIDLRDFANFQNCFDPTPPILPACAAVHDFDTVDASDGDIDLNDYARSFYCSRGPFVTPDQACGIPMRAGAPPPSGTFGMHGRAFDVLSDGSVFQDFRARTYLPQIGRWLQRDRLGFAEGPNLYETFHGNPAWFVDPQGQQIEEIINLFLTGRFLSNEEIELALARGDITLAQTRSRLLSDVGNAVAALGDVNAILLVPQGFEQGFRQPAVEATTARFQSFIAAQVSAGRAFTSASSNLTLSTLFLGDLAGATQLGEALFGVDLATNEALTGGESIRRAVQGGSTVTIVAAGPQALRAARARTAAAATVRGPALANIAERQASALSGGGALPVLNAEFVPRPQVAQAILQQLTTREAGRLALDLTRGGVVLSEAELRAGRLRPDVARLTFGKAAERLVAQEIRQDPLLRTMLDPAGIGRRGLDILGIGPTRGLQFDITTASPRSIAEHLARPYGQNLIIITYERPATFTVFPP